MHRLPTWQVWKLIHRHQKPHKYRMLARVLRIKETSEWLRSLHNLWLWLGVALSLSITSYILSFIFSFSGQNYWLIVAIGWLPRLAIAFICLQFGVRLVSTISRQRVEGRYDLFRLLPAGEFVSLIDIVRAFRYPYDGRIRGEMALFLVVYIFACCFSVFGVSVTPFSPAQILSLETMPLWGVVSLVEYLQTFVATILIAILISHSQSSTNTQVSFVAWFIVLQVSFFMLHYLFTSTVAGLNIITSASGNLNMSGLFFWSVLIKPLTFIGCSELVNFVLWQAVKRRLEAS
jgi:hypothetical protein